MENRVNHAIMLFGLIVRKNMNNYVIFSSPQRLLVGIPQSGRSKLATKAVLEAYPHELTHMDIRNSPFDDVHGLEERFSNKTFDVNDAIASIIRGLAKTLRGELDALEEVTNDTKNREQEASESLNRFKRALRRFKEVVIPANKPHLFFVNHMEAFSSLTRDVVGLRALEYFMLWLINLTRDYRNIRVLLTCSPLFYYDFMMDIPFRDNLQIIGLGDLPKHEAQSAYEKFVSSFSCQFNSKEKPIPSPPDFEQVYSILGGRLHDLSKFVELYYTTQQKVEDYPDLGATISKFSQVLYPELYGKLLRAQVSSPVLWEKEHVVTAWKMLLNAPNHVVPYVKFIEQIPMNIFYSMLRYGLVLFRPQSSGYCDFEICKKMDTVTFRRPLDKIAAKKVLENLNENSLNSGF
nr:unnamed protein product [Naegleria fowleri]